MPNVQADLVENLKLTRTNGVLRLVRHFFCTDLLGTVPTNIFASALDLIATGGTSHTGDNVPANNEQLVVTIGSTSYNLFATGFDLDPFPPRDADLIVTYTATDVTMPSGYTPTRKQVGGSVEERESDYDATNRALPLASRKPIQVEYDAVAAATGVAKVAGRIQRQGVRLPYFAGKVSRVYDRETSVNPETLAKFMLGRRNSTTWLGQAAGTAMCVAYVGTTIGDGRWSEHIEIAIDDDGKFQRVGRFVDRASGQPVSLGSTNTIIVANLTNENGAREVTMQGDCDFNVANL